MPSRRRFRPLLLAVATGLAAALPAASQQGQTPPTQLWLDVATHSMPGMPELGGLGRAAMGVFGGAAMQNHYGAARVSALPGRYVDIALLNRLNPGVEAEDLIPAGLKLGKSLPLLPPKAEPKGEPGPSPRPQLQDGAVRILIYWGCSPTVRPGQPREIRIDVKDGQVRMSGAMQGRYVPDGGVDVGPSYALWPNERHRKMVPQGASLAGEHRIVGAKVPESLQFTLTPQHDFMPAIALRGSGSLDGGQTWSWQPVDRARGYFLHAMGMQGDAMVFWSSAETADAGMGIFGYLPPATVERWIREKVLLAPSVTSCAMPKGIFAAPGARGAGGGMLQMIAFGPEDHIVWPPRPSDPKAAAAWKPEWSVRVRNKSTATAMLGMDVAAAERPGEDQDAPAQPEEKPVKRLLRGLLGGG